MKVRILAAVAALALGTAIGGAANATTYFLTDGGGAFPDTNFGTVTVTGTSSDLHFDVLLNGPYKFVTTGSHVTFAGNLGGSIGSLATSVAGDNVTPTNFNFATGSNISDSPFNSDFDFSLDCKTGSGSAPCGQNGGGGHPFGSELIFDILGTNLSVQPANHPDGSTPIFFAADVVNTETGSTGVIGATGGGIPEPATWGLMIAGFGAIGAAMRRNRSVALTVA